MSFSTKHLLYAFAGIAMLCAPFRLMAEKGVVIVGSDGSQIEHSLNNVVRIAVGTESVTLHHSSGDTHEMQFGDLDRILIGAQLSAIEKIMAPGDIAVWPTATTGAVNVAGAEAGTVVEIYNLEGKLTATSKVNENGAATLDISAATSGIYLVTTNGHTVKIVKK